MEEDYSDRYDDGEEYEEGYDDDVLHEDNDALYEGSSSYHGSYEEYDHSDEELYVYDQSCRNCRFYNRREFRCMRNGKHRDKHRDMSGWCLNWKGKTD